MAVNTLQLDRSPIDMENALDDLYLPETYREFLHFDQVTVLIQA